MLAFGKAGSGAGRGYCLVNDLGVAGGGTLFLCNKYLIADRAVLAFGKAGSGAGRGYCLVDDLGVAGGADIRICIGLAAGAGIGRVACRGAGRSGHCCDEIVGVRLVSAAAGADTVFIIMAERVGVIICLGLSALAGVGSKALLSAARRCDNSAAKGVGVLLHMLCCAGERVIVRRNAYLTPRKLIALIVHIREAAAIAERGVADCCEAKRQVHALERRAARECGVAYLADISRDGQCFKARTALEGIVVDFPSATRDIDACKASTAIEGAFVDISSIRERNSSKSRASRKCIFPDTCHAVRN